jgi:hypothetical protein
VISRVHIVYALNAIGKMMMYNNYDRGFEGGANDMSLNEAKSNFKKYGATNEDISNKY